MWPVSRPVMNCNLSGYLYLQLRPPLGLHLPNNVIYNNQRFAALHTSQRLAAHRRCTQEDLDRAAELRRAGVTAVHVAAELGRGLGSIHYVYQKLARSGSHVTIRHPQAFSHIQRNMLFDLKERGSNRKDIKAHFPGVSYAALEYQLRRHSGPNRCRGGKAWTDQEEKSLVRMRENLKLSVAIIETLLPGRSAAAIRLKILSIPEIRKPEAPKKYSSQEKAQIRTMRANGSSWPEIATVTGRTPKALSIYYNLLPACTQGTEESSERK